SSESMARRPASFTAAGQAMNKTGICFRWVMSLFQILTAFAFQGGGYIAEMLKLFTVKLNGFLPIAHQLLAVGGVLQLNKQRNQNNHRSATAKEGRPTKETEQDWIHIGLSRFLFRFGVVPFKKFKDRFPGNIRDGQIS